MQTCESLRNDRISRLTKLLSRKGLLKLIKELEAA